MAPRKLIHHIKVITCRTPKGLIPISHSIRINCQCPNRTKMSNNDYVEPTLEFKRLTEVHSKDNFKGLAQLTKHIKNSKSKSVASQAHNILRSINSFIHNFKNLYSFLTLINATYFQNYLTRGGAQSSSHQKSAVSAIFLHTKQQKTLQGTLGTQDLTSMGSKTSHGPTMDPTGPLNWTSKFLNILEPLSGYVYHFYIIHSLAPLPMLEHFVGHCGTLPRQRGPSWTFMDPQMDPKWTLQG